MAYSKSALKKLSSTRGLVQLLSTDPPDFDHTLKVLKYESSLEKLQIQLNILQNWIVKNDERLVIIFEGGEFAGKGEAIRIMTRHLNPRSARIVALPKPNNIEVGQWYFQRYINQLPKPGEIVFFDRSWYNRAIVEPVNDFCTKKEYDQFMSEVNHFERMIINDGIILIKLYLSISKKIQAERIEKSEKNPLRSWELSKVDKNAQKLWSKYKTYEKLMFSETNSKEAPWKVIDSNDPLSANLKVIKYVLSQVDFKE